MKLFENISGMSWTQYIFDSKWLICRQAWESISEWWPWSTLSHYEISHQFHLSVLIEARRQNNLFYRHLQPQELNQNGFSSLTLLELSLDQRLLTFIIFCFSHGLSLRIYILSLKNTVCTFTFFFCYLIISGWSDTPWYLAGSLTIPIEENSKLGRLASISKCGHSGQRLFSLLNSLVLSIGLSMA